jgi:hypothetical protein
MVFEYDLPIENKFTTIWIKYPGVLDRSQEIEDRYEITEVGYCYLPTGNCPLNLVFLNGFG